MFSYTLCKSEVTYMGSSGCGTCRIMKVTNGDTTYLLQENLHLSEYKPFNGRSPGYAIETRIEMSDTVNEECEKYISAYKKLEEAKAEFEKAKQAFSASSGAEPIQKLLVPQKGPLPLDEVINNEDVEALKKLVEEAIGSENSVTSVQPSVEGYSIGMIVMKTAKPIPMTLIEPIKYKEYEWSKHDYKTHCITFLTDTTNKFIFVKKGGYQYPPFRTEDYNEITRK